VLTFGYISLPTNVIPLVTIGTAEWWILAPYWRTSGFDGLGDWLLFNCVAGAAGLGLTQVLIFGGGYRSDLLDFTLFLIWSDAIPALCIGLAQAVMLRRVFRQPWWWTIGNVIGVIAAAGVGFLVSQVTAHVAPPVPNAYSAVSGRAFFLSLFVPGFVATVVFGAITGLALVVLVKRQSR
jgi:hypothetical protein